MIDPVEFGKAMGAIVREAVGPLLKRIEELEARPPIAGEKGEPGKDAEPIAAELVVAELLAGDEVKTLVDLHVAEAVAKYFEESPVLNGNDGKPGEPGEKGAPGDAGAPGKDGVGTADALINQKGELVLTMTDGRMRELGVVVGKNGDPGKDGADGFGFDDLNAEYDGQRGLTLTFVKGERTKEFKFHLPINQHKGYWREGTKALVGDGYTSEGTTWVCVKDTDTKPDTKNECWVIGARRGRDGDQGPEGKAFKPDSPVKLGGKND